jgi:TatD DNase family protein
MNLVDTHSHIYLEEFDTDRDIMLERALETGVRTIIMPAIDASSHEKMKEVESQYPEQCYSMMGLHPCSVKENFRDELEIVIKNFGSRSFKAVGETGLDFYWDLAFKPSQLTAFHEQIELALQYDIPIVIHSRESIDDCIKIVSEHQKGKLKGVFHCFSGDSKQANEIIDLGFFLGIGGVVTFKNSGLDKVMEGISLENVILETDAPYLAPVPFRGKRNECSYLKYVVEKLAGIKNKTLNEIAEITTSNAEKLFSL